MTRPQSRRGAFARLKSLILRLGLPIAHKVRHRWRMWRGTRLSGVSVVARDAAGRVLLLRHSYGPSGWYCPGGGIGRGESPEAASERELREETGLRAIGLRKVGDLEETLSGSPHTAHIFTCTVDGEPKPDRGEILAASMFALDALPADISAMARSRIDFALAAEQGS